MIEQRIPLHGVVPTAAVRGLRIGIEKNFDVGIGKNFGAMSRPSMTMPPPAPIAR